MALSKLCPLKTRSIALRFTIAIWWFTDRSCTCNSHFEPLDGGIGAQPYGAVETVPLQFSHLLPQQPRVLNYFRFPVLCFLFNG